MMKRLLMTRRSVLFSLAGMLVTAMLALYGCGGSGSTGSGSYVDPVASANITTTKTANALIDAATLKQWIDEGKVNAPATNYDRVVILSVTVPTSAATSATAGVIGYNASHIPGAQLWDTSKIGFTRREGVADMTTMVADGASIDSLIQTFGITKYTTIVLTTSKSQNFLNPARAYFTLRYWGFPKERIKILDGGDDAWESAKTAGSWSNSYSLTSTIPNITPSTYSVRNNYTGSYASFDVRTSIGQMMDVVDKVNATDLSVTDPTGISILDARGGTDYATSHIAHAVRDDYSAYGVSPGTNTITVGTVTATVSKTRTYRTDLTAYLLGLGVTADKKMNYIYCASGYRASVPFFALDGILGWPVTKYDGSWGQWNGYRAANLPAGSIWLVDNARTVGALTGSLPISDNTYLGFTSVLDPEANQILKADKIYFSTPPVSTTTNGGAAGGTSGC